MRRILVITTAVILSAGSSIGQNPLLEAYISEGLMNNQGLKQKQLDYAIHLSALKEARSLFFPDVSVNARYTVADGGRTIVFPVGDLLNPVYSTLNLLTGSQSFPQIENEEFSFYRPREHETKVSLIQPIFNTDIIYNYRIREDYTEISRIGVDRYRRELIREISKAYYNYQQAYHLLQLADTTLLLAGENVRVSRRLFENDMVTVDAVYRAESDMSRVEVQRAQAKNGVESSRSYFNFLLNKPLDTPVELMTENPLNTLLTLEFAQESALAEREELLQIQQLRHLNKNMQSLQKGKNSPGLFGVVDYGFQGEDYRFTSDDDFVMASLVLKWDIFHGSANLQKARQVRMEGEKLVEVYSQTEQQIRLEVVDHYYGMLAAYESILSSKKQEQAAKKAYQLISRKYAEGQASLLELIDARTSQTSASASLIIAQNEYFIRRADLDYAMGGIDLSAY